ncbi:MAG: HAD family hydrolase [Candidatus Omnitrophota bacterium]
MIKLAIFDIDGTIVDAYEAIRNSLNFTLKRLGYPKVGALVVRCAVGHGDRHFIEQFVDKKDVNEGLRLYRAHHEKALLRHSKVIPGTRTLLRELKARGCKLAIASNRPPKYSKILLKHLDLLKYFDMVACAKDKTEIKPKPILIPKILKRLKVNKDEALYVGDMAIDVRAGRNAGVRAVAVLGGSSSASELRKAGPCAVIKKLSNVLHLSKKCQKKTY